MDDFVNKLYFCLLDNRIATVSCIKKLFVFIDFSTNIILRDNSR